jgi:hypothetical protein
MTVYRHDCMWDHAKRQYLRDQADVTAITKRLISAPLFGLILRRGQGARERCGHAVKAARSLCPTSLTRNGGSSYSEEPGMEIL